MLDERTTATPDLLALEAPGLEHVGAARRRYQRIGLGMMLSDALCACAALLLAYQLGGLISIWSMSLVERVALLVTPPLWVGLFQAFSLYAPQRLAAAEEFRRVIGATSLGTVLLVLLTYRSDHPLPPMWIGLAWFGALFLELATRRAWRWHQHRMKLDGRLALRTLIVGANRDAAKLAATLRQRGSGFRPIGYVLPGGRPEGEPDGEAADGRHGVLGELGQLRRLVREKAADCLFITSTSVSAEDIAEAAQVARQEDVEIRLSANIAETLTSRLALQQVGPVIALSLRPVRLAGPQAAGKRAFDLVAATVALLLTLPLWLGAAVAVRLSSRGPVLFHQERVTKGGRRFRMHKFRTMRDRPAGTPDETAALLDPSSPFFKLGNDPRITTVGRYLRRFSIDELPQLLNILKGEMSLVGPRPLPAEQVAANLELLGPRHEVPAGMTGWWQINGRSEVTPEEALHLDQFYIENWSLTLDLYIVLKTFGAVLRREGAL
jgi:exopolysaccharide biosynthesis polyprenyl glycosylphosphotransferase